MRAGGPVLPAVRLRPVANRPDIAIIGPGVVGTTLGILSVRAGYRVIGVAGRSLARARAAAEAIGADVRVGPAEEIAAANWCC